MFPIVHNYINKLVFGNTSSLMILGGLWPDLASGSGMARNDAHIMGEAFASWCKTAPELLPLAHGIISHGNPYGADWYSDENWDPKQKRTEPHNFDSLISIGKGWSFVKGRPWIEKVLAATHLPERLGLWKSHNFVEMSLEMLALEEDHNLNKEILIATKDTAAIHTAAKALNKYTCGQAEYAGIINVFTRTADIFAIREVNPETLAYMQKQAFTHRHNVHDPDIDAMAELLVEMRETFREDYKIFMPKVVKLIRDNMKRLGLL